MTKIIDITYSCDSDSYLTRARVCLESGDPKYLFYAAFELRCFVESRHNEYLEAQEQYRSSLPKRWKIGKQAKELGQIFDLDKVQKITNTFEDGFAFVSRYVPVSNALRKSAERLGELLHSQQGALSETKIEEIRIWLKSLFDCSNECNSGNMLSPVLFNDLTGKSIGGVTLKLVSDEAVELVKRLKVDAKMIALVEYVDFETETP